MLQSSVLRGCRRSSDPVRDPVHGDLFLFCLECWSPRGGVSSVVLGASAVVLVTRRGPRCWHTVFPTKAAVIRTPPSPVLEPVGGLQPPRAAWAPEGLLRRAVLTARPVLVWQVHIEFTEGEDKITLEGPTEDVSVAQEQIEAMVKDLVRGPQPRPKRWPRRHRGLGAGGVPEFRTAWEEGPPRRRVSRGPATEGAGWWQPLASRLRSWWPACLWGDLGACRGLRSPQPALCSPRRLTGWIM